MQSNGDVNKAELRAVLQGLTNSHQAMANHLSTLSTMVTGMNEEQVDETAVRVATELGAQFRDGNTLLMVLIGPRSPSSSRWASER